MEYKKTLETVEKEFDTSVIPSLMDYIKIDNLSMNYDLEWNKNGKLEQAAELLLNWAKKQNIVGFKGDVIQLDGMSPIIFVEVESNGGEGNVFMYGHYDKQPHFNGWMEGTGPCKPVIIGDLLYGRGGADDGYALYTSLLTVKLIQQNGLKHGKFCILIEGSEESGSPHLMPYIKHLEKNIGKPDLMICMDSGCKDYERLWVTTSLRGVVIKDVDVECLKESVHSGAGGGFVPDSFTVIRQLLDRVEDSKTARVVDDFQIKIPESKLKESEDVINIVGKKVSMGVPLEGVEFIDKDLKENYLNSSWRANLTVVGQSGLPGHSTAGNVLRDKTSVRISLRLPPTKDPKEASLRLDELLTKSTPWNSKVTVNTIGEGNGWASTEYPDKMKKILSNSSMNIYGKDFQTVSEGGSIPFIGPLSSQFPESPFIVLGVLGPGSNAHAANECLHIPYCKKITAVLTHIVYEYFQK